MASRREVAAAEMARLELGDQPEDPAVIARQARERAEKIAKHDAFWDVAPGDVIRGYKLKRQSFDVGDPEGRDD